MAIGTDLLLDGLHFGESPRWHEGRLWYSDFYDHAVHAVDLSGNDTRLVELPGQPSGLGWMPDGSLLVVSMLDHRILRVQGAGQETATTVSVSQHADISSDCGFWANDMVVDSLGRAYVGNFGFDYETVLKEQGIEGLFTDDPSLRTNLSLVQPDGTTRRAADELVFPNGMVILPDGSTLVVAETFRMALTAFDIEADGSLSNRRTWADLSSWGVLPDGICLDAEEGIWLAAAASPRCVRVGKGGSLLGEIQTSQPAFACALGGPEGKHLFVMTAPTSERDIVSAARDGKIELVEVEVPHAGPP